MFVADTTQLLVPIQTPERREEELQGVKKVHFTAEREQSPLIPSATNRGNPTA